MYILNIPKTTKKNDTPQLKKHNILYREGTQQVFGVFVDAANFMHSPTEVESSLSTMGGFKTCWKNTTWCAYSSVFLRELYRVYLQ